MSDDRPIHQNTPENPEVHDVAAEDDTTNDPSASHRTVQPGEVKPLRTRLLVLIALVILALDLITKIAVVQWIAPGKPVEIIGDVVTLRLVRNPGAAFSMATGMTWLLTIVAVCVVIAVIRISRTLRSPWWALGLGLVLGGALGNLIDRFFRAPGPLQGHVVDFVSVGWWPVFNVADSSIVCGAILLVVLSLFGFEPNGQRTHSKKADAVAQSEGEA
ncbi:signal peptidase II [Rhodococcus sp. G-MC3]|uniref:signal peptidase II n=1 Tax=Rhodococcus sp. G-MC3 TaxID=3046209 RepID=UPI003FA76482